MNYPEIARKLTESLALAHSPVSVSFTHSIPAGVDGFDSRVPAGCCFWEEGSLRTFATSASDHSSCAIGMYTHNLEQAPGQQEDLRDALAIFRDLGYLRDADLALIPVMNCRTEKIVYGPLAEVAAEPAVVLLFVNATQALIASEAAQQVENRVVPAMGRPACAVIPLVANTAASAISFGCCGARAYVDIFSPDISIFAIPGKKLELYTERIQKLAAANSTLTNFHRMRRAQIASGATPTVKESLASASRRTST